MCPLHAAGLSKSIHGSASEFPYSSAAELCVLAGCNLLHDVTERGTGRYPVCLIRFSRRSKRNFRLFSRQIGLFAHRAASSTIGERKKKKKKKKWGLWGTEGFDCHSIYVCV